MKIVICLKEVIDTRVNLGFGQISDSLFYKGISYRLDPQGISALSEALTIKSQDNTHQITLISLGPERIDSYLRSGLACGADKAVRIWDESFQTLSVFLKSKILARAISLIKADLVLTGSSSKDNASGLTGPLIASWLGMPCVCDVTHFQIEKGGQVTIIRNWQRGINEKLLASLPVVLSVSTGMEALPDLPLEKVLVNVETDVPHLSLADLGFNDNDLRNDPVRINRISFPRPRPKAAPLDSNLPAYYRILALLQGGLSKRSGRILEGNVNDLVDQLYASLIKEGRRRYSPGANRIQLFE